MKDRKKETNKDEEAIAFCITLEQRFAIGPEAGAWRKKERKNKERN